MKNFSGQNSIPVSRCNNYKCTKMEC